MRFATSAADRVRRLGLSPAAWLALFAVYVIWGSTYLAIRVLVETIPPLIGAGTRWIVAGVILYLIGERTGDRAADRPRPTHWRNALIIGTALCFGGNGLVSMAEQRISSGMAALLVATVPLFVALFEWVRFRAHLPRAVIAGLVVGFVGTGILVGPRGGAGAVDAVGALLVLAAAAAWAAGSLFARRADLPRRPLVSTGMEMICGGLVLYAVGGAGGEFARLDLSEVSLSSAVAVGYLAVFGSIVAFSSYVWLLRSVRTSIVTTYAYVNPIVAVILGAAILGETVTVRTALGGGVIIAAVAAIVMSSGGEVRAHDAASPEERADLSAEELPA